MYNIEWMFKFKYVYNAEWIDTFYTSGLSRHR